MQTEIEIIEIQREQRGAISQSRHAAMLLFCLVAAQVPTSTDERGPSNREAMSKQVEWMKKREPARSGE